MSVSLIDGHIDDDVQGMTVQQAIEILEVNAICSPKATKFKEAVELAKQAIEKQIPKKPVRKDFGKFYCSVCDDFLLHSNATKYCSRCGHAVDWNVVLVSEDECRELVLKEYPEYEVSQIIDYGDWYEIVISIRSSPKMRIFSVQKNNGYIREIGV